MTKRTVRAYAEVALGRQRSPANDAGPHMIQYLRAANVKDGILDLSDVKEMNFDPKEQAIFALRPGDVLVTEGSGSITAVGASSVWNGEIDGTVCYQNTLLRLRPRAGTHPSFLAWWCRYAFADGLFASAATGANIYHLSAERVRSLPMTLLPLAEQRAIADYLDAETARIDTLMAKKQQLIHLLEERRTAAIDDAITTVDGPRVPVRRLSSRITSGPRGWAEYASETGTPFIRITNIQRDQIDLDMSDTLLVNAPLSGESHRTRVRTGDVLVSITADIGSVGVVSAGLEGSNISQHVALIRPENCEPEWLAYAIRSTPARYQLDSGQYGGTKTQLSLHDVSSLSVPYPAIEVQRRRLAELMGALASIDSCSFRLRRQIGLLAEHRQALITAAVTGELRAPGTA